VYPVSSDGASLLRAWWNTKGEEDAAVSGVLADWLSENRTALLAEATGPDPAVASDPTYQLDLLIHWLREVRCFGRENVPA
jgi:hypothetical protein